VFKIKNRSNFFLWVGSLLLLFVAVFLFKVVGSKKHPELHTAKGQVANVGIMRVQVCVYDEKLSLPTRLEADSKVMLSSELHGRLQKWLIAEGEEVRAGQAIAVLDLERLENQLQLAQARQKTALANLKLQNEQLVNAKIAWQRSKINVNLAKYDLQATRATLELAKKELARTNKLFKEDVNSEAELDVVKEKFTQADIAVKKLAARLKLVEVDMKSAETGIRQAEAGLLLSQARLAEADSGVNSARIELKKGTIYSPIDGCFEEYLVEEGEIINPGRNLGYVYNLDFVRAIVDVPDRYVPFLDAKNKHIADYIKLAMPGAVQHVGAKVVMPGPPKLMGSNFDSLVMNADIVRIAMASNPESNTFKVELRLANPGRALKQGNIAQAEITYLQYKDAIIIPISAVQVSDRGPRVFVVNKKENKYFVEVRDIEPLSIQKDMILIRSVTTPKTTIISDKNQVCKGIKSGDLLIVSGIKGLMNGEEVNVIIKDGVVQRYSNNENSNGIIVPPNYNNGSTGNK